MRNIFLYHSSGLWSFDNKHGGSILIDLGPTVKTFKLGNNPLLLGCYSNFETKFIWVRQVFIKYK